jgi:hypothetical protein
VPPRRQKRLLSGVLGERGIAQNGIGTPEGHVLKAGDEQGKRPMSQRERHVSVGGLPDQRDGLAQSAGLLLMVVYLFTLQSHPYTKMVPRRPSGDVAQNQKC